MIENLKPYPEYKDSGVAWLGQVPRHWDVLPHRALFAEVKDRDHPDEQMLSVTIKRGIVKQKALLESSSKKDSSNLDKTAYKLVLPSDIAYNKMRAWQGAIGVSALRGIISPAYVVMRLQKGNNVPSFFHYLYRTPQFAKEAERWSYGITSDMWSLRPEHFVMIYTAAPPRDEQAAIARFLAWATNRLDRAIGAKCRIIALLQEQKQAIIHRAVTRGLDPSVPLKDSGIPWLGQIPEHWEVRRAKYLFREVDRRSETGAETHLAMSQRLGLVPSSMVQSTLRSQSYAGGKLCSSGDLVLNRLKAHLGVFAIAKQDGVISPDYTVLREQALAHADYYACILKSPGCRGELQTRAKGIVEGFWRLYTGDFYEIRLPTPPIDEQLQIMDLASQQTRDQDAAISRLESEITLLREYRTRLVADVVTGKLDVREVAAGLPEVIQSDDVQNATEEDLDLDAEDEVPENLA
jgi:type I restriction enzyme S subunit